MVTGPASLVNAAAIIRGRLLAMALESQKAANAAREAGQPQIRAWLANTPERARISSLLPRLPDDGEVLLSRLDGGQPTGRCPYPAGEWQQDRD